MRPLVAASRKCSAQVSLIDHYFHRGQIVHVTTKILWLPANHTRLSVCFPEKGFLKKVLSSSKLSRKSERECQRSLDSIPANEITFAWLTTVSGHCKVRNGAPCAPNRSHSFTGIEPHHRPYRLKTLIGHNHLSEPLYPHHFGSSCPHLGANALASRCNKLHNGSDNEGPGKSMIYLPPDC